MLRQCLAQRAKQTENSCSMKVSMNGLLRSPFTGSYDSHQLRNPYAKRLPD